MVAAVAGGEARDGEVGADDPGAAGQGGLQPGGVAGLRGAEGHVAAGADEVPVADTVLDSAVFALAGSFSSRNAASVRPWAETAKARPIR
ncbi:hypothetical protein PV392_05905 [Streptomyces sp. ME03-5709C]|nr:hypothetical protein [Streptomyces sp. ME03-5709C]